MSHWNYRVVKVKHPRPKSLGDDELEESFGIREVYYNEDGSIYAYSTEDMSPGGETLEELREDLKWMTDALEAPVLNVEEIVCVNKESEIDWNSIEEVE